jgi:hypothetical protein
MTDNQSQNLPFCSLSAILGRACVSSFLGLRISPVIPRISDKQSYGGRDTPRNPRWRKPCERPTPATDNCTASRRRCSSCSTSAAPRSTFRCAATRPPLLASCARQQSGSLWRRSLTHVLTSVLADQRGLADVGAHVWSRSALRFGRRAPRSVLSFSSFT